MINIGRMARYQPFRAAALLLMGWVIAGAMGSTDELDGAGLAARMEREYQQQEEHLCGYSVQRFYTLENRHLTAPAHMQVELTYAQGVKSFRIISIDATGVARRSLLDLLQQENESEGYRNSKSSLSPRNYQFTILGMAPCAGGDCYKVKIVPKQRSEYLVEGTGLVSATAYRFVQLEGTMSRSPSLWLSKPVIEQHFENVNGFWLPSYNHSKVHVLFFGDADLTVRYSAYRIDSCPPQTRSAGTS